MTEDVMIKSYSHGLLLVLNPKSPIEDVLTTICRKFAQGREFFGSADLVLSIEGRKLSDEETDAVVQAIELNSDVHISLISLKDKMWDTRAIGQKERFYFDKAAENAKIIPRSLHSAEKVVSDTGVLILGDVPEDATVEADGNLIVTGIIRGHALAGATIGESAYILAGGIEDAEVTIYKTSEAFRIKKKKRLLSNENEMILVQLIDGQLSCKAYEQEIL
ncbi:septum site-determining protein MinC [Lachnospiraceae bacterium C10]|nr:septum site-determining protein MinC [Lachnospiraceae bacterium C10]